MPESTYNGPERRSAARRALDLSDSRDLHLFMTHHTTGAAKVAHQEAADAAHERLLAIREEGHGLTLADVQAARTG